MVKSKVSTEEKQRAVEEYLRGYGSSYSQSARLGVHRTTFKDWVRIYQALGVEGLWWKGKNQFYSAELKITAVEAYLAGEGSQAEICKRYKILSKKQLREWIKVYNGHKELRPSGGRGSEVYLAKGRITTLEERIEIVGFCIENGRDYAATIEKYGVSYQQVYSWVRKYETHGATALEDKRGKRKDISDMTEVEQLRAENRLLKSEIKYKEMEKAVLKKVKEIGRRGY